MLMDLRWSKSAVTENGSIGPIHFILLGTINFTQHDEGGQMVMADVGENGGLDIKQRLLH